MDERQFYVYILANDRNTVLYIGVTNNLKRRVHEHRMHMVSGFTSRYNVRKLVYFESCGEILSAITREKQLKGGSRAQKIALIESKNPTWRDLYEEICG
jgi:putative endonuclease